VNEANHQLLGQVRLCLVPVSALNTFAQGYNNNNQTDFVSLLNWFLQLHHLWSPFMAFLPCHMTMWPRGISMWEIDAYRNWPALLTPKYGCTLKEVRVHHPHIKQQ